MTETVSVPVTALRQALVYLDKAETEITTLQDQPAKEYVRDAYGTLAEYAEDHD